jgi:hypothetical protein
VSKDVKKMIAEIRGALDQYPREQLQEILAWVFKEYVVDAGATPAQGALAMLDARTELEGLSFAELMTWLQLHLDVPELAAFDVQGNRVSVRHGGRAIPIEVAAQPPLAATAPPQAAPASAPQPTAPQQAAGQPPAPPPPQSMPPPNPPPPSHAAPPAPPANPTPEPPKSADDKDKKDEGGASSRFSWLEVD